MGKKRKWKRFTDEEWMVFRTRRAGVHRDRRRKRRKPRAWYRWYADEGGEL